MASQEQARRANNIKAKIDKTQENDKCRMCGKAEECKLGSVVTASWPKRSIKDDIIGLE